MINQNEIVIYRPDFNSQIEVRVENDTVWLSIDQMAELFGRDKSVVGKHVRAIFAEGELIKNSVWAKNAYTATDGKTYQVDFYNLDVIISVGYRVKSQRGTQFRQWANKVLKEYLLRGYAINERLMLMKEEIDYKLAKHENLLQEHQKQIDFFVKAELPPHEGVFMDGQIFDAFELATRLIKSAKKSICLIDNYVDDSTLAMLSIKGQGVRVVVVTHTKSEALQLAEGKFNQQYGELTIQTNNKIHDRFLIIDEERLYLIGASLKDLGKRLFAFIEMNKQHIPDLITRIETN